MAPPQNRAPARHSVFFNQPEAGSTILFWQVGWRCFLPRLWVLSVWQGLDSVFIASR